MPQAFRVMMLHNGPNEVDGIPVEVIRKRIRRYNLRVDSDGMVKLSVPTHGRATSGLAGPP